MKISISTILFTLCVSGTVLAQDVRFNSDSGADFSKYVIASAIIPKSPIENSPPCD